MPTYAYACTACDHRFDIFQSFSEDSLTVCPECEGRLRKVFNAVGVVFKGGGFYRTDSRSGSSSTLAAGANGDSGAGSDSGSSSSDAGSSSSDSGASGGKSGSAKKAPAASVAASDGSAA